VSEAWLGEAVQALSSVAIAVAPLTVMFLVFQIFLLKLPPRQVADILKGTAIAAVGLVLFLLGIGIGFLPFGRVIGETVGALDQWWLFVLVCLLVGFFTTWGEPAVRVLCRQVDEASNGSIPQTLVLAVICLGVAFWAGLGALRIVFGIPLLYLLVPGYTLVVCLMWLSSREFIAIAVDAGGVATGPLANSFLLALALGATAAQDGLDPIVHGLGFVALIALAPITSLMILGALIRLKAPKKE
jgi:hypothetical protein